MFEYIKGVLAEKLPTEAIVETSGIGYHINIPLSTFSCLPDCPGEVKLFLHHVVREDAEKLYGFFTKHERELFRELITISMIGPKVAIAVLSGIRYDDFVNDVRTANVSRLKSIPGIGAKTAERLILEMKTKIAGLSKMPAVPPGASGQSAASVSGSVQGFRREAFDAMVSLGYIDKQVEKAFARIDDLHMNPQSVEEWIKKALQVI